MAEDPWAYYAHLLKQADSSVITDTSWAIDEALDEVLDYIEAGSELPSEEQFDTLIGNRRRKYRERRELLTKQHDIVDRGFAAIANRRADQIDLTAALRRLSRRDRAIIVALAKGETYGELARRMNCPIGSVKTWVHRARQGELLQASDRAGD